MNHCAGDTNSRNSHDSGSGVYSLLFSYQEESRRGKKERAKAVPYEELKKLVEESNKAQENVIKKLDSVALTLKENEKLMKEI